MRLILAIQVLNLIFNVTFAWFQVPVLRAFRFWVPPNNPYEHPYHTRAVIVRVVIASILLSFYYRVTGDWRWDIIFTLAALNWFVGTLSYNTTLGWLFEGSPFSLGHTAVTDKGIESHGKQSGFWYAIGLTTVIIGLNITIRYLI